MSEPQIPREVWGMSSSGESKLIDWGAGHGLDDIAAFASREGAQGCINGCNFIADPVLIGGSALLDEVAKLRRVAEAASQLLQSDSRDKEASLYEALNAALEAAGHPKSEATEATEDKT